LAAQAPFDLGHEVFRKPQIIEGLLEGCRDVLCPAEVSCKALVRFCDNGVVWLWRGVWRLVCVGT
jgi:hypothetical protein